MAHGQVVSFTHSPKKLPIEAHLKSIKHQDKLNDIIEPASKGVGACLRNWQDKNIIVNYKLYLNQHNLQNGVTFKLKKKE